MNIPVLHFVSIVPKTLIKVLEHTFETYLEVLAALLRQQPQVLLT